jgi:hypothetical protein
LEGVKLLIPATRVKKTIGITIIFNNLIKSVPSGSKTSTDSPKNKPKSDPKIKAIPILKTSGFDL